MKNHKFSILNSQFSIILLLFSSFAFADNNGFQTTTEEMVKELTRTPIRYRSFVSKKRAIKVIQRIDNKVEEMVVMVDEGADVPMLKTKIEFDVNSSALKLTSFLLLKKVGLALVSDGVRDKKIIINGHTDSDGSCAHNLGLSFDRAESVKAYLVANFDIPETRLQVRGYGEELPLKPNTSAENKQINRRVEFVAPE